MRSPALVLLFLMYSGSLAANSAQDIEQRLELVESYLNSNTAFNIANGKNQQAIKFLKKAELFLQQGLEAIEVDNLDQAAEAADQSIRAYKAASQVSQGNKGSANAAAIKSLIVEIESYHQAFMAALREKGPSMAGLLNQGQYKRLMKQARAAHDKGDGGTASNRLNEAKIMVINALTRIRSNETVVYGKEFQTPADEYRYEDGRYAEYARLTELMLTREELDGARRDMLEALKKKAEDTKSEAEQSAASGDFNSAIEHMEEALKKLVQGLQLLGVPVSL